MDIKELDRLKTSVQLMSKLEEGEWSAKKNGWITADEIEVMLGL